MKKFVHNLIASVVDQKLFFFASGSELGYCYPTSPLLVPQRNLHPLQKLKKTNLVIYIFKCSVFFVGMPLCKLVVCVQYVVLPEGAQVDALLRCRARQSHLSDPCQTLQLELVRKSVIAATPGDILRAAVDTAVSLE